MAINFPTSPASGQTYSYGINRWIYNGYAWDKLDNHPGISGGNQTTVGYTESLSGATFTVNVVEGKGSDLDADLLQGISGERFSENLETGLLYGGLLSINSGNTATFDITAGRGIIVTPNASTTAYPNPSLTNVSWSAKTGVTLSGLTSQDITYVSINSSGTVVESSSPFTDAIYDSQIPLGAIIHPTRSYISFAKAYPHVAYSQAAQTDTFVRAFGPLKLSGHEISGYDSTLQLSRTSGSAYALGRNYVNDPNNPNVITDTNATPASIMYRLHRGATSGTWITTINTAIDPTKYDDGTGTLNTVPAGKYTIQRIFFYPNEPTVLLSYYGRAIYNSIDTAQAAIPFEPFSESADTADSAIFCAYIVIKSGISNFSSTSDYSITQAGLFRSTSNVGGGGVAVARLDDLSDVTITSVANNQALVYDSGTANWVNKSFTSLPVVTSFNGLTGAVTGVSSWNGQTGAVSFSTYVATVNGATGTVITYSGSTGNIQYRYGSGISATNYFTLSSGPYLGQPTDILTLSGETSAAGWYQYGNNEAVGLKIERGYNGLGFDEGGGVGIRAIGIGFDAGEYYVPNLRLSTNSGNYGGSIILSPGDSDVFSVGPFSILSSVYHSFGSGIDVYNTASTSNFSGPITGVTASFTGLLSASKGISAAGGATFANNAQAATFTETSNNIRVTNNARSWFI